MRLILIFFSLFYITAVAGQVVPPDTVQIKKHNVIKWGIIPVLAFDSDIGFKYGANMNFFDFGKDPDPENYLQSLFIRVVNSTKNSSQLQALFDSDNLFKSNKLIIEASYIVDKNLNFFGYNGSNALYHKEYEDPNSENYINQYFYTHERKLFRLRTDYQHRLSSTPLRLYLGFALNNYVVTNVDYEKYSAADGPNDQPATQTSLYDEYVNWNVISEDEKDGGLINYFTLGFIYDSRNHPRVTTKGFWMESYVLSSSKYFSEQAFSKFIFSFRHYIEMQKARMVLSYRLSSQSKISGDIPFYMLPTYFESQINRDGLGGAFNMRGITRNRIAADGFALGNFELRRELGGFQLFKLDFDFLVSAFIDAAYVTQDYGFNDSGVPDEWKSELFNNDRQTISTAFGLGLYIIYNANNIMSVYYGASYDKQLGNNGLYVGSSFLF